MYFIRWGEEPRAGGPYKQIIRPTQSDVNIPNLSYCQFLGDVTQKGRARSICITVSFEGVLICDALLDTEISEIYLVSAGLLEELNQMTNLLGK